MVKKAIHIRILILIFYDSKSIHKCQKIDFLNVCNVMLVE